MEGIRFRAAPDSLFRSLQSFSLRSSSGQGSGRGLSPFAPRSSASLGASSSSRHCLHVCYLFYIIMIGVLNEGTFVVELTLKIDGRSIDQMASTPRSKHSATEQRRRSKINDRQAFS
ncbi:hypothetical protein IEQ34_011532 [Dendrobium chrysotoxum]|uniref:Uncharacterized protein n=1 Tax=Dendrobium chrysotoxum TaxID=161865 RepID=A0AAV7GSX2_DENCH|nr:hypothetical protein IEQ34_011532 [Dendrobium chrysotoxum]